jgi:Flp pilus assembly pilin Flp
MKRLVQPLSKDDADSGPIESGVIAIGIALALLAILGQIGGALNTAF